MCAYITYKRRADLIADRKLLSCLNNAKDRFLQSFEACKELKLSNKF